MILQWVFVLKVRIIITTFLLDSGDEINSFFVLFLPCGYNFHVAHVKLVESETGVREIHSHQAIIESSMETEDASRQSRPD